MAFHEVRFPTSISLGASGGPERRTEIVTLGSGHEERNSRWASSRRRYNAGYGIKSLKDMHTVLAFFEERRGRLHAFRWRDRADHLSGEPGSAPTALDQEIGIGDGTTITFPLKKTYGQIYLPYERAIDKPELGSVRVAVGSVEQTMDTDFIVDTSTGIVTFLAGHIPAASAIITAGFLFDVPVRFDMDFLEINLTSFDAGEIPSIPLVEVRS
ncbi:MAG: DUF2460 domain-containing protein [Rhizobiales bacterium]|nr:DUF2460 domain-containing protein [Hyphomicrobiales bacterium]